jgi:hypothetical protein
MLPNSLVGSLFAAVAAAALALTGCGDDGARADARPPPDARIIDYACNGQPLPDMIPQTLSVQGMVFTPGIPGASPDAPVENAILRGFERGSGVPFVQTVSDVDGLFELAANTDGTPKETHLEIENIVYLDSHLYPPTPLYQNVTDLEVALFDMNQVVQLEGRADAEQDDALGLVIAGVVDCSLLPVGGATVSTSPEVGDIIYQEPIGFPDRDITATSFEGFAFMFNVPVGDLTVSAQAEGMTFRDVTIPVVPLSDGVVTLVGIQP